MNPKKRIGEMLMEAGIIDETQLKAAPEDAQLVRLGIVIFAAARRVAPRQS